MKRIVYKIWLVPVLCCWLFLPIQAQQISGIINSYAAVSNIDYCTGILEVTSTASFEVGMKVVMIQMQGAEINSSNSSAFGIIENIHQAGRYEKNEIEAVTGTTISLRYRLLNQYDVSGAVQLVSMPEFENVTTSDTVRAQNWNGSTGGVLALKVNGTLAVNGSLSANGAGFRGGAVNGDLESACSSATRQSQFFYDINDWRGSGKGEGIAAYLLIQEAGQAPQANGGGGGNDHNTGGGGGANTTSGGIGGQNQNAFCNGDYPGMGGIAVVELQDRVFLGGGGGAGHTNNSAMSMGGNGGGIIIIEAENILGNGTVTANGLPAAQVLSDGAGGGGSGGTIIVQATNIASTIRITAKGGDGGSVDNIDNSRCMGPGGGGSGGRILSNMPVVADVSPGQAGQTLNSAGCDGNTNGAEAGESGILENLSGLSQAGTEYGAANEPPTLTCRQATSSTITFEWVHPEAESYKYSYQINGQTAATNLSTVDDHRLITGLAPGDSVTLTVQANIAGGCGSPEFTVTCGTVNCEDNGVDAFANTPAAYCYDGTPIRLEVEPVGGQFSGTAVMPDGTIIPDLALQGSFFAYYFYQDSLNCMQQDSLEITVSEPLARPVVECGTTTGSYVTIDWTHPSATSFEVQVRIGNSMEVDTFLVDDFTFIQDHLTPGTSVEFRVKALSDGACGKSTATVTSCQTNLCGEEEIEFINIKPFYCTTEAPSLLQATPPGGIFSGVGIDSSGRFSPSTIPFLENEEERRVAITYLLETSPNCPTTPSETVFVQVLPGIQPPVVTCGEATPTVLTLNWEHPTANSYNILYGVNGSPLTSVRNVRVDSFALQDLEPLSAVRFLVEAIGTNVCGNSMPGSIQCFTDDCPVVDISFSGLEEGYCSTEPEVQIEVSPSGGIFSGTAVDSMGLFSPTLAELGRNSVLYEYKDTITGCTYRDSSITQVSNPATLEISNLDPEYCYNEAPVQLNATPTGGTFSGNGISTDGLFNPSATEEGPVYITYTYTDSIGCETQLTDSTLIIVPLPLPVVSCDSTTLSSVRFIWSHPSAREFNYTVYVNGAPSVVNLMSTDTSHIEQNLQPGDEVTIEVAALSMNECGSSSPVATQICSSFLCPENMEVEFTPVPDICLDSSAELIDLQVSYSDSTFAFTESWSGVGIVDATEGIFDPNSPNIQAGTIRILHTLTVESCRYENELFIQAFEAPLVNAGLADRLTCGQPEIQLQGQIQSFFNDYTYNWTTDTGTILSGADTLTPLVNKGGWYRLIVENGACITQDSVFIEEDFAVPHGDAGNEKAITCEMNSVSLGGDSTSTGAEFEYEWSGPNDFLSNLRRPSVTEPGNYQLVVRNVMNQCESEPSVVQVVDTREELEAIVQVNGILDCRTDSVLLDASISSFGQHIIYEWSDASGFILPDAKGRILTVTKAGNYTFVVLDTLNGCGKMTVVEVQEDFEYPIANAGEDQILACADTELELDGSASSSGSNFAIVWSNGEVLRNGNTLHPTIGDEGLYVLTIQNRRNGCIFSDSVEIILDEHALRGARLNIQSPLCTNDEGGQIIVQEVIGGNAPYVFALNFNPFQQQPVFRNLLPGNYELTIQESNGCEFDTTIMISAPQFLELELGQDYSIQLGDSLSLSPAVSVGFDSLLQLQWFADGTPVCLDCETLGIRPYRTTTYALEIMDVNGCTATDQLTVFVNRDRLIFAPNAFSPNGDNQNDYFTLFAGAGVEKIENLRIFDRWGALLYQQEEVSPNDASSGWDGTYGGQSMSPGVFIFTAEVTYMDGRKEPLRGEVTLVR